MGAGPLLPARNEACCLAAGVLDIGMGLIYAPSHGIPTFYIMGEKDSKAKNLQENWPDMKKQFGDLVALRTHPGVHVWPVPEALAEALRWFASR